MDNVLEDTSSSSLKMRSKSPLSFFIYRSLTKSWQPDLELILITPLTTSCIHRTVIIFGKRDIRDKQVNSANIMTIRIILKLRATYTLIREIRVNFEGFEISVKISRVPPQPI